MFGAGEFVVYGTKGVCEILEIGHMDGGDDRLYYIMSPLNNPASTIFSPIDNNSILMRYLITPQEADQLLHEVAELPEIQVVSEKQREQAYKDCLKSGSCRQYACMIKTLYERKRSRLARGKKVTSMDERYTKLVEEALYTELAKQLERPRSEVAEAFRKSLAVCG